MDRSADGLVLPESVPVCRRAWPRYGVAAVCLALALALSACGQAVLYAVPNEAAANEMVALLEEARIEARKVKAGDASWEVRVEPGQMSTAFRVLRQNGLPRADYETLGRVFRREGMVSSPTEERVRYIHALSEELSKTISSIDGVVLARVHVVLPQNDPLATTPVPSSASVFIKHHAARDLSSSAPEIRGLVVRSIEGIKSENVHIAFFVSEDSRRLMAELDARDAPASRLADAGGLAVRGALVLGALGVLLLAVRSRPGQAWIARMARRLRERFPARGDDA
jgi:type III secretion protein J